MQQKNEEEEEEGFRYKISTTNLERTLIINCKKSNLKI